MLKKKWFWFLNVYECLQRPHPHERRRETAEYINKQDIHSIKVVFKFTNWYH